jgi:GNAT superfamily N-acetyltransferase
VRVRPLDEAELAAVDAVLPLHRLGQEGVYLVAWEGAEPVGHGFLIAGDPPELADVFVREEHRRRGVATALTRAAEERCGAARLRLTVGVGNAAARALYERCGYVDAGVPPRRVQGTILLRGEPLEIDDTLLTLEKQL